MARPIPRLAPVTIATGFIFSWWGRLQPAADFSPPSKQTLEPNRVIQHKGQPRFGRDAHALAAHDHLRTRARSRARARTNRRALTSARNRADNRAHRRGAARDFRRALAARS